MTYKVTVNGVTVYEGDEFDGSGENKLQLAAIARRVAEDTVRAVNSTATMGDVVVGWNGIPMMGEPTVKIEGNYI